MQSLSLRLAFQFVPSFPHLSFYLPPSHICSNINTYFLSSLARDKYVDSRVSTLIFSPTSINMGTFTVAPELSFRLGATLRSVALKVRVSLHDLVGVVGGKLHIDGLLVPLGHLFSEKKCARLCVYVCMYVSA